MRDLLGLVAGSQVEIEMDGATGEVRISPVQAEVWLEEEEDGLWVTRSSAGPLDIDAEQLRDLLEAVRDKRL
jgi:hypothetical protein